MYVCTETSFVPTVRCICTVITTAALNAKADLGLSILPNPLIKTAGIDIGEGVGFDSRSWEWILYGGKGDSQPWA